MLKQQLRTIYKQKRLELSATQRLKFDDLILIQLQRLQLPPHTNILLSYWPLEQHAEVNTLLYTHYLEHAIPGLRVAFPVIDPATSTMKALLVEEETEFVENQYNIPEPETGELITPADIDVVFVPLLAHDMQGYRVGYGKGYYDRYLAECRTDVITIGFSYFDAVDNIDDRNQFDVPLSYCITPDKIYEF